MPVAPKTRQYQIDLERTVSAIRTISVFAESEDQARQKAKAEARHVKWNKNLKDEIYVRDIHLVK